MLKYLFATLRLSRWIWILGAILPIGAQMAIGQELLLSGVVQTNQGEPVAYATIEVHSADSLHNTGGYTDEKGLFAIQLPAAGKYLVRVSFVGLTPSSQEIIAPTSQKLHFSLSEDTRLLSAVTVVGRKKLISIQPSGAIAYNMAKDIASQSEDLLSAMRRVPMVIVDGQGNMQVKGTSNFSIYLNGKPFRSATMNPSQVLATIPASRVSKIEVISNPDASYEADSGSTVINIITDGKKIDGYQLRVGLEGNTKPLGVGDISFNLIKGKFKLSTSYLYRIDHQKDQPAELSRTIALPNGTTSHFLTQTLVNATWQTHTGRIMAEYEVDSIRTIYADAHINYRGTNARSRYWRYFSLGGQPDSMRVFYRSNYNEGAFEGNLRYRRLKRSDKKELFSLGYRFTYSPDNRYNESSFYNSTEERHVKSVSNGGMYENTLSLDAVLFRNQIFTVKGGVLDVFRLAVSKPRYYTSPSVMYYWKKTSKEGHVGICQVFNALAGYLNGSLRWGQTSMSAGARVEKVTSHYIHLNEGIPVFNDYVNVIPRASITTSLTDDSQISLAYYYGITRPSIWVMNPYKEELDEYRVSYGNPDLQYAKGNNVSLDALTYGEKYFINLSAEYSHIQRPIYEYFWVENNNPKTLYSSYTNGESTQNIQLYL